MAVTHNGVTYRVADAHAHIYPGKIAEKATANVGRFYDIEMEEVGLPHILSEEGKAAGIDRYLVCSVATKVEQVEYGATIDVTAVCTHKTIGRLGPLVEGWTSYKEPWEE